MSSRRRRRRSLSIDGARGDALRFRFYADIHTAARHTDISLYFAR